MVLRLKPLDLSQIQTASIRRRSFSLTANQLASVPAPAAPLQEFYRALPKTGEAAGMLEAAELMAQTVLMSKPVVWIIDGSLVDAGLSPLVAWLMRRGLIQCLVMNGGAALRDYELAFFGMTCEEPGPGLVDGMLGLSRETGEGINAILNEGVKRGFSVGECLGRGILERQPKHFANSLLATGAARLTPTTVHVCVGADGFHRYPGADGAMLGKGSLKDVHILTSYLTTLPPGAMLVAAHSDAALTQVFLHSYALARNLNQELQGVNFLRLGQTDSAFGELPGLNHALQVSGALEIIMPLLLGALFSLVE